MDRQMEQKLISQEVMLVMYYVKCAERRDTPPLKLSVHKYSEAKSKQNTKSLQIKRGEGSG
jgi:hypothetical protein